MFDQGNLAGVVKRIEEEYRELPGLRLTERQMQRLWDLDRDTCAAVIKLLIRSHVVRKADGEIVADDALRASAAKAAFAARAERPTERLDRKGGLVWRRLCRRSRPSRSRAASDLP